MTLPCEHVLPPLQPDLARERLAHLGMDPTDLDIKGVQRQQRAPLRWRYEQRGSVACEVVSAHKLGTMASCAPVVRRSVHGTAISAAATRRRSPIMMLKVWIAGPVCMESSPI